MKVFAAAFSGVPLLGQPIAEPWRRPLSYLRDRRRRSGIYSGSMLTTESPEGWKPEESHERAVDGPLRHIHEPGKMIAIVGEALRSMGKGEISISAYDTAMVALVKRLDGGVGPQFPSTINWIIQNQLPDGSWGDEAFFLASDRLINTLACVVSLASWNIYADKCEMGLLFIQENISRLAEEEEDWMLVGFEIVFPSLLEMAKNLALNIPYDHPSLQAINEKRNLKLTKIPKDLLHAMPTTLLHSIEGMVGLDWEKLLKLRCRDGSFHCSPAATAFALQQTGDKKCFDFLDGIIKKFHGGVPCIYPMDVFEHLWAVDRLTRLGIHRHFTSEVDDCLDYVYRHWTEEGLAHKKICQIHDIDDTAMGFRLLRLHGYDVNPCVFKHFEKDGEFFCYHGESIKSSITPMYNTYRASQVAFPSDDDVLRRAEGYCHAFLQERRTSNKLKDKWVIAKDIPGEVKYAMDFTWNASLPRIETRMYLDQYGGGGDVWIGKVLYRMPLFCNEMYLEVAKSDFNNFQRLARLEWHGLRKWYFRNHLQRFGGSPKGALTSYFLASSNIFEPNRQEERLGWAQMAVLAEAVSTHLRQNGVPKDLAANLEELIDLVAHDDARGISLREAWKQWLMAWIVKKSHGSIEGDTALLLVRTIEICSGRHSFRADQKLNLWDYSQLERLTSSICCNLATRLLTQNGKSTEDIDRQVDLEMQELSWRILQGCHGINRDTKQIFLHVVKSFYYVAHCSADTVDSHIAMVIFQDVI